MDATTALKQRKELKRKKPDFRRQDAHKKDRLSRSGYRRPRGLQSKMRLHKKGYARYIAVGYGSPSVVKFADPSGLIPFIVSNLDDLSKLDSKTEGALIASTVGTKKRIEIVKEAIAKKITILNIKDSASYVSTKEAEHKKAKEAKDKLKKSREEKSKQKEKQAEKKPASDSKDASSDDDKKAKEKEEKDKVLTSKE